MVEKLSFQHPAPLHNQTQHLYFNKSLNQMIELTITKGSSVTEGSKAVYNEYMLDPSGKQWAFVRTLNQSDNSVNSFIEWHTKSLYPFSLNLNDFKVLPHKELKLLPEDTFKVVKNGDQVKVLNTQDGIELVIDARSGEVQNFMALQYSFPNTKASFYDRNCGHFDIREVISRLQNFYESVRR